MTPTRIYTDKNDADHLALLAVCRRLYDSRDYEKRSELHDDVLIESGKDEDLVDAAVFEFCIAENLAAWARGDEPAFPGIGS